MVGIKVSTGIKLSTGEVVEGYYLDKEGYDRLFQAGNIDDRIKTLGTRVSEISQSIYRMQEILQRQLLDACKLQMLTWLEKNFSEKSFKQWDIQKRFQEEGYGWEASRLALESLVKDGKIVHRGSSWYRLQRE